VDTWEEHYYQVFAKSDQFIVSIMKGSGLCNCTGIEGQTQNNHRNMGQSIMQYLWQLVFILLVVGNSIGLKVSTFQFTEAQHGETIAGFDFNPVVNESVISKVLERGPDLILAPEENMTDVSHFSNKSKSIVKRFAPITLGLFLYGEAKKELANRKAREEGLARMKKKKEEIFRLSQKTKEEADTERPVVQEGSAEGYTTLLPDVDVKDLEHDVE